MAASQTASSDTLTDPFGESLHSLSGADTSDYPFANFDIVDYVSNDNGIDIFAEHQQQQQSTQNSVLSHPLQHQHNPDAMQRHHQAQQLQQHSGLGTPMSIALPDLGSTSPNIYPSMSASTPASEHYSPNSLGPVNPESATERLKSQLAKQLQLQRLQHMQNQLLQQQIDLISGSSPPFDAPRSSFQGLLTPGPSSEIQPQAHPDFVSPMILQQRSQVYATPQEMANAYYSLVSPAMSPHVNTHQSMTAPASMVFYNSGQHTPGIEAFSPLTSPALGPSNPRNGALNGHVLHSFPDPSSSNAENAEQQQQVLQQQQPQQQNAKSKSRPRTKRRSSVDESLARKRQSPLIAATVKRPSKEGSSTSRTSGTGALRGVTALPRRQQQNASIGSQSPLLPPSPWLPGTTPVPGSSTSQSGDGKRQQPQKTPSPVDLNSAAAMPPPPVTQQVQGSSSILDSTGFIAPVTPGSIMNLGNLARLSTPTSYEPTTNSNDVSLQQEQLVSPVSPMLYVETETGAPAANGEDAMEEDEETGDEMNPKAAQNTRLKRPLRVTKAAAPSKDKAAATRASTSSLPSTPRAGPSSGTRTRTSLISPNIKAILPGGLSPAEAVAHLATKSNYQNILEGRSRDLGIGFPQESHTGVHVKKTSHKAAEQKRRDSLKSGFDDLRLLLPPITYDPDGIDATEPRAPGSLPPRGPPRNMPGIASEHPNRGVSKLALLRGANEHLVRLQRRITRRDESMEMMRRELEMLRLEVGINTSPTLTPIPTTIEGDLNLPLEAIHEEPVASTSVSGTGPLKLKWKGIELVDLNEDVDAVEHDGEEEKFVGRVAARPTEHTQAINSNLRGSGSASAPDSSSDSIPIQQSISGNGRDGGD